MKCKCGGVNRAPALEAPQLVPESDDPLGLSNGPVDLLAPIRRPASVEEPSEAQEQAAEKSATASYWGKPRVTQVENEGRTEDDAAERIAAIKRRKEQQKLGPLLTRISCGISTLVCFIFFAGSLLGGAMFLFSLGSSEAQERMGPAAIATSIAYCGLMLVGSATLFHFGYNALRASFNRSRRVRNETLPAAKAGASAMVFAIASVIGSLIGVISLVVHFATDQTNTTALVGPLFLNFSVTLGCLAVAGFVFFVGRYRHGSVKFQYLWETTEAAD